MDLHNYCQLIRQQNKVKRVDWAQANLHVASSPVPLFSRAGRRVARGALRAGKKKEGPGIQRSRMRQFFQFFSEFGYFSGHFSIFTRENVGVAS